MKDDDDDINDEDDNDADDSDLGGGESDLESGEELESEMEDESDPEVGDLPHSAAANGLLGSSDSAEDDDSGASEFPSRLSGYTLPLLKAAGRRFLCMTAVISNHVCTLLFAYCCVSPVVLCIATEQSQLNLQEFNCSVTMSTVAVP